MASSKREASPEASPLKGPAPKAVPEDTSDVQFEDGIPLSPMAGDQSVQFISGTPANGDAKVEIGDSAAAPTFVGLGKEELMKYANDPFWVRLRWFLFIMFWVLWIAMLVGAIVIIVLAPRCAEKKTPATAFYQMRAADLVKDGKIEEHVASLHTLGVDTIIISEALQHESNEPEAVTNFEKLDESVEEGLFTLALEKIKEKGIKILLQIVPNHSGTHHEWFNDTESNFYVRKPYEDVAQKSVWVTQDKTEAAWTRDPHNAEKAYLHQFSGNVADLNFANDNVVAAFKTILSHWKDQKFDGFVISKASFLVENLEMLMSKNGTRNQPENVQVVSRIVGLTSTGPNLVELDQASNETINEYVQKGLIPVIKSIDTSSPEKIRDQFEELFSIPKAVINFSKASTNPEKFRLLNLLAGTGGIHTFLNHENVGDKQFVSELLKFQKENPRGKQAKVEFSTEGDVISAIRKDGDEHLILANMGTFPATYTLEPGSTNITSATKGVITFSTPNAKQKAGDHFNGQISLNRLSGVVIKLEKKEEEA